MADFTLRELQGFRYALTPHNDKAKAWIRGHIGEEQSWLGQALFIEHARYAQEILSGIRADGLTVEIIL